MNIIIRSLKIELSSEYLILTIISIKNSCDSFILSVLVCVVNLLFIIECDPSALIVVLLLLSVHAVFTLSWRLSPLLHLELLLHLLEAWIVVLGVERVSHLAVGYVHGGVAARVSILVVDIVCLQIISRWLLLLSLESSIDILNHRCILRLIPSVLVLIIFIHQLYFNSFIFILLWLLQLLLLCNWGISLILNETLHEILCIRLHLLQREALVLHTTATVILLLLIQGILVLLDE